MLNKKTIALRAGLVAAGAPLDLATPPFKFLSSVMANENNELPVRIDAAKALLPYTNHRLGLIDTTGRNVPVMVQVVRFSDGAQLAAPRPVLDMGKLIEMDMAEDVAIGEQAGAEDRPDP